MRVLPETNVALSEILRFFLVAGLLALCASPWQENWFERFSRILIKKKQRGKQSDNCSHDTFGHLSIVGSHDGECFAVDLDWFECLNASGFLGNIFRNGILERDSVRSESYFVVKWQGKCSTWRKADLWKTTPEFNEFKWSSSSH